MGSRDLNDIQCSVTNIICYPVGNYKNISILAFTKSYSVFVNAYFRVLRQWAHSGCLVLVAMGKGCVFLMGRETYFNVPQEHVTAAPLFQLWPS